MGNIPCSILGTYWTPEDRVSNGELRYIRDRTEHSFSKGDDDVDYTSFKSTAIALVLLLLSALLLAATVFLILRHRKKAMIIKLEKGWDGDRSRNDGGVGC